MQFLAEHPQLLTEAGAPRLAGKLQLFASWRLAPPLRPLPLARCPPLLEAGEGAMQEIVDILMGYGMTYKQLGEVLLNYPPVLRNK